MTNDAKFMSGGLVTAAAFGDFLIDSFETLLSESARTPRMMSVGMHPRIVGHPGRLGGIERLLNHIAGRGDVWVCRREDIAEHWRATMPAAPGGAT